MAGPVRFAVFGTGSMAATMVAAMRQTGGIEVLGVASRSPERAREFQQRLGLPRTFAGVDEIAADPSVDALYIASTPDQHAALAIAALSAGKPVLCEKPCAVSPQEAERISEVAASSGALFMEAIATPFLPAVAHALEAVRRGELGQARHFSADFGYPATGQSHPVCFAPIGGGVLLDRAIYLVALARLALGPVAAIESRLVCDEEGIDTHAALLLTHRDGGTSQLTASFAALLGNSAAIGCSGGAILLREPLLACERMRISVASAPAERVSAPSGGLRARLKQSPFARRLAAAASARKDRTLVYGPSSYAPELSHFRDLVMEGRRESPVLPTALSVEIHGLLAAARSQGESG